ncbi:hypothetical protein AAC387_Pa08g2225 [Persea americana]
MATAATILNHILPYEFGFTLLRMQLTNSNRRRTTHNIDKSVFHSSGNDRARQHLTADQWVGLRRSFGGPVGGLEETNQSMRLRAGFRKGCMEPILNIMIRWPHLDHRHHRLSLSNPLRRRSG